MVKELSVRFAEIAGIIIIAACYNTILHTAAPAHFKMAAEQAFIAKLSFTGREIAFSFTGGELFDRSFSDVSKPPLLGHKEIACERIAVVLDDDIVTTSRHESADRVRTEDAVGKYAVEKPDTDLSRPVFVPAIENPA